MTKLREPYHTTTDVPKNISELTINMFACTLARMFHRWQHTMPHYHFTEEVLRRICQLALVMYESDDDSSKLETEKAHEDHPRAA
jgi:hypothetical protein